MWQGLMLAATIGFSVARLMQRKLLNGVKHDELAYAQYFGLLVTLIILPVALFNNFAIPPLNVIWPQVVLMIFLYGFANIFFYKAVKLTPISEVMVIAATSPIWTTITSVFFFGEKINSLKLLGVLLAVAGVVIVFYQKDKFKIHKGLLFAFLAQIFYGVQLANDRFLLQHFNQTTYTFLYYFLPTLFIISIYPNKLSGAKSFLTRKTGIILFSTAFLYAIASLFVNTSFQIGAQASQIGVMMQLNPIFTIVLGGVFLKERENLIRKLIGGIIVVAGVLLI